MSKSTHPLATLSRSVRGPVSTAILETKDDTIEICKGSGARLTCQHAATILRQLADHYDALALEEKPFHEDTHKRINLLRSKPPKKS